MSERFVLEDTAFNKLAEHIENTYPDEACGILLGSADYNRIYDIKEATNREVNNKQSFFSINPLDIYKLEQAHKEVVGFYHSHPNKSSILSSADKEYMVPGLLNLVFSVTKNGVVDMKGYKKMSTESSDVMEEQVLVHI